MASDLNEKITVSSEDKSKDGLRVEDGSHGTPHLSNGNGILDHGDSYDVAIMKDGIKLHPQPTADPLDPLNWTSFKKHTVLAIFMYLYVQHLIYRFCVICFMKGCSMGLSFSR